MTIVLPTGVPVSRIEVGNPEWLRVMSASKIAAVLGLSPWESRFSLYHRMSGAIPVDPGNNATRRGNYLEAGVAAWFADQLPEHHVEETGTWVHADRPWQAATPDRLVTDPDGNVELLEIKTASVTDGWGEQGSDDIPVYYRAQVIWQLDTLGLKHCHVAVLLPFLEFRSYIVEHAAAEAEYMRAAALAFLNDLEQGNQPDIDNSTATYQVVRQLHPDIDGEAVEIPRDLALGYRVACEGYDYWRDAKQHHTNAIVNAMGTARYATHEDERVAMRVPGRNGQPPFLRPCKPKNNSNGRAA